MHIFACLFFWYVSIYICILVMYFGMCVGAGVYVRMYNNYAYVYTRLAISIYLLQFGFCSLCRYVISR